MRILFIPRFESDVSTVIELHRYCNENNLEMEYYDRHYTIELPFSSHHITYILLHFELEFKLAD